MTRQENKPRRKKTLWLLVTKDEFELPLYVADTAIELAKFCRVHPGTINAEVYRQKPGTRSRYRRVILDDDLAIELAEEIDRGRKKTGYKRRTNKCKDKK